MGLQRVAGFQYISHTDSAGGIFFEKDIRQILLKNMSVTCWQGPIVSQGAAGSRRGGMGGGGGDFGTKGRAREGPSVSQSPPWAHPGARLLEQKHSWNPRLTPGWWVGEGLGDTALSTLRLA